MSYDIRYILKVCLVPPPLVALLMVLGSPGLAWWRYLVVSVGISYFLLALGAVTRLWLERKAASRTVLAGRTLRAVLTMCLVAVMFCSYALTKAQTLHDGLRRLSTHARWEFAALLLFIGLLELCRPSRSLPGKAHGKPTRRSTVCDTDRHT